MRQHLVGAETIRPSVQGCRFIRGNEQSRRTEIPRLPLRSLVTTLCAVACTDSLCKSSRSLDGGEARGGGLAWLSLCMPRSSGVPLPCGLLKGSRLSLDSAGVALAVRKRVAAGIRRAHTPRLPSRPVRQPRVRHPGAASGAPSRIDGASAAKPAGLPPDSRRSVVEAALAEPLTDSEALAGVSSDQEVRSALVAQGLVQSLRLRQLHYEPSSRRCDLPWRNPRLGAYTRRQLLLLALSLVGRWTP